MSDRGRRRRRPAHAAARRPRRGQTSPVQVGIATNWQQVSTGGSHACAATAAGELWCWGLNASGQLGDGTTTQATSPVQVGAGTAWTTVATGATFSCATTAQAAVRCWGDNADGQLGLGDLTSRTSPAEVAGLTARTVNATGSATWVAAVDT